MSWRLAITCLALAGFGAAPKKDTPTESLRRGVQFLMSRQAEDGGWHSTTYGSMKQGAAVTSLILYAMSHLPPEEVALHRPSLLRAFEFLRQGIRKKGYVVNPDGSADFPTYATALLLLAAQGLDLPMTDDELAGLTKFVVDAQLTETREFGKDSIHHGGWDLMGAQRIIGQTSGTNVSISRFATQALAANSSAGSKDALARARRWSRGVQNLSADGGFYFTPETDSENNKASSDEGKRNPSNRRPRTYGTCTCDGVLLLVATGLNADGARVAAALKWLADHPDVDVVPGFQKDARSTDWHNGLRYYYYAALAEAFPYLPSGSADRRRAALIKVLSDKQRTDGSWRNTSARMREDDPLICTSFAVSALGLSLNTAD